MLTRADFRPYQNFMVDKGVELKNLAIWADLGLGKSVMAMTIADELYKTLNAERILVVSTIRNVEATWPQEVHEWEHLYKYTVVPIRGNEQTRLQLLQNPSPVHAINLENLAWLVKQHPVKKNRKTKELSCTWPYDMVILDESGLFRNQASGRFKALRKMQPFINRMVQLTGTPMPKGLENLWSQIFLLDQGERLGRTITAFRQRWFYRNENGFGYSARDGAKEEILAKLSDICFTLKSDDYLDVPKMIVNPVLCRVPDAAMVKYKEFAKESIVEMGENVIIAKNGGVLFGKLSQLASGAFYTDTAGNWDSFHDAKLDTLSDLFDENDLPLLIAYNFKSDKARLKEKFPDMVFADEIKSSKELVNGWNAGKFHRLAIHPKSGGHGLNMQKGHSAGIIWFSLTPDLELYLQLNGRLERSGQKHVLINTLLVAEGTIDQRILKILADKESTQDDLTNAFRVYIEGAGA